MGGEVNRPEAEQVAAAVAMIRPDWLQSSLVRMLEKHQHRPARDVMLALVWCAYDPATDSPGRINQPGPWWDVARLAGAESSRQPERYTPPTQVVAASPERIRQIREQAAAEHARSIAETES